MSNTPTTPEAPPPRSLQFSDLPPELHDLIWEHAAPAPRLFHICHIKRPDPDSIPGPPACPGFHHLHPPPSITAICRSSRHAALRLGLFLLPILGADPDAAVWFAARSDVLYLDRTLRTWPEGPPAGFDRVAHVGVEWRRLFRDGSMPVGEYAAAENRGLWVHLMAGLFAVFPGLRTLRYVLPRRRYQGGMPWGREPLGAGALEGRLVELPGRIMIPLESGHASWEEVGTEIRRALEQEDVAARVRAQVGDVHFPPEIEGQWLLRGHHPPAFESPSIKDFTW